MVINNNFRFQFLRTTLFKRPIFPRLSRSVALLFLLLTSFSAVAAKIDVQVDRNPVEADESFSITFTANDSVDGQPDFRPLEEFFKIVNRNQSSSIQIINGRMNRQTQWTLFVMPKRTGDLWIPSISFGDDKSPRVPIKVNAASRQPLDKGNDVLYLETEVDHKTAYVQSQIIYTVRVYQAVNLLNAGLSELTLSDSDAIVEKMGDDNTYDKRINGRRYKVFEKRYVIFPQKSGTLTIKPTELQAQYVDNRRALRTKLLDSDPINIEVKPKPALSALQNSPWLPAKQMQISEQWPQDPPVFKVGEPLTRTITVTADGLSSSQLPQINMGEVPDMKLYPDQAVKNDDKTAAGVVGTRQEKIALIPTKAGHYVIPAIEIPWWNTEKGTLEYLKLPKRDIQVLPAAQTAQQNTGNAAQNPQPGDAVTENSQPARTSAQTSAAGGVEMRSGTSDTYWMWVSLVAFIGWGVTALAWWRGGRPQGGELVNSTAISKQANNLSKKQSMQQLKSACAAHNAPAAKDALLQWAKCVWPNQSPTNLNELSRRSGGELGEQLLKLNKTLYSNQHSQWNGDGLWQAFSGFDNKSHREDHHSDDGLVPLYKTIAS